jgi:hypothetical protein
MITFKIRTHDRFKEVVMKTSNNKSEDEITGLRPGLQSCKKSQKRGGEKNKIS